MTRGVTQSRRTLLTGLAGTAGLAVAGGALAGCWPSSRPAAHPSPHPLTPTVTGTMALLDRYEATMAALPDLAARLQPLVANHRAHLDALRSAMGAPASPSASAPVSPSTSVPPDAAGAIAALRTAEQAGQADAARACLAAAPAHAALLGSIAACRATHIEVLFS